MDTQYEEACIEGLRSLSSSGVGDDELRAAARAMIRRFRPVIRQALSVYRAVLPAAASTPRGAGGFLRAHSRAWSDYLIACASAPQSKVRIPDACRGSRHLFLGWHFPEFPSWLGCARATETVVLLGREVRWIEELVGADQVCCFRSGAGVRMLGRAFHDGRPVFAMLDHCYPDTRGATATAFLGRSARTPTGVIELARRFDYDLQVVAPRSGGIAIVDGFHSADADVTESAQRVSHAIEREIASDPPRWLLWSLLHERWIGAQSAGIGYATTSPRVPAPTSAGSDESACTA